MVTQAYVDWDRAGRPWDLARPIEELYALAKVAGVGRLGTLGSDDKSHLKNDFPQDHTPFSATAWPDPLPGYIVCACDLEDGPWSDRLLADARAGRLPWLKYLNFRGMQFSRKTGWEQRNSSDRHLHVSGMSNHTRTGLNGYNPFTGETGEDVIVDPATEKDLIRRMVNVDESYLHSTLKMEPDAKYKAGNGESITMPNKLVRTLSEIRSDVTALRGSTGGTVDPVAVADRLAGNPEFVAALARELGKVLGERLAN